MVTRIPTEDVDSMELNTTHELIEDIRQGKMVILMDDEDRENEGDLIIAAEMVTPEIINFMARHACGLICLTLTDERCAQLRLPLMVYENHAQHSTNFTLSIEAAEGVTTGISAADRAHTIITAVAKDARPEDIVQPGHIFPLMANPGGVLSRAGHTEAGCDLARLAGKEPAAVIVEIMNKDGSMARRADLENFAQEHGMKIGTIADLIHYRMLNETTVLRVGEQMLMTQCGEFQMVIYEDEIHQEVHIALIKGEIERNEPTLVRVTQIEAFRDVLGAELTGRKSWSILDSLSHIEQEGKGVLVILATDDPSADILAHASMLRKEVRREQAVRPKVLGDYSTVGTGSQILRDLGVGKMRLLSPPVKYTGLSGFDLEVVEYIDRE